MLHLTAIPWPEPELPPVEYSNTIVYVTSRGYSRAPEPPSAKTQAEKFQQWLGTFAGGKRVSSSELEAEIYPEWCKRLGWVEYRWNTVARELRQLTGNRKYYDWVWEDGIRKRVRVFPIPLPAERAAPALSLVRVPSTA